MIVVGAPPLHNEHIAVGLGPISRKLHLGRVRGLSRKTIEVPGPAKSNHHREGNRLRNPSTLSQQLPRESMAKCAKSVGETSLPKGDFFFGLPFLF